MTAKRVCVEFTSVKWVVILSAVNTAKVKLPQAKQLGKGRKDAVIKALKRKGYKGIRVTPGDLENCPALSTDSPFKAPSGQPVSFAIGDVVRCHPASEWYFEGESLILTVSIDTGRLAYGTKVGAWFSPEQLIFVRRASIKDLDRAIRLDREERGDLDEEEVVDDDDGDADEDLSFDWPKEKDAEAY